MREVTELLSGLNRSERMELLLSIANNLNVADMYDYETQLRYSHVVGLVQIVNTLPDNCINFAIREYEQNPIWYDIISRYK